MSWMTITTILQNSVHINYGIYWTASSPSERTYFWMQWLTSKCSNCNKDISFYRILSIRIKLCELKNTRVLPSPPGKLQWLLMAFIDQQSKTPNHWLFQVLQCVVVLQEICKLISATYKGNQSSICSYLVLQTDHSVLGIQRHQELHWTVNGREI